jgi:hypothetical protein
LGRGVPLAEICELARAVNLPKQDFNLQLTDRHWNSLNVRQTEARVLEFHAETATDRIHRHAEVIYIRELDEFPLGAEKHIWQQGDVDA